MKKVAILFLFLTGMVFTGKTQFYIGGNLNYNLYLGGTGMKSLGLGLTGEWSPDQDVSLTRIGFSYGLPATDEQIFTVEAIDPFVTSPQYMDVTGKSKVGFMHFTFDYKRFFGDADYEDGGVYGFGGVGLSIAKVSYTVDSYDESKYRLTYSYDPESYFQACLRLGLGMMLI